MLLCLLKKPLFEHKNRDFITLSEKINDSGCNNEEEKRREMDHFTAKMFSLHWIGSSYTFGSFGVRSSNF